MLCLPNGERIKLDERRLRVLFEVEDLSHASPATVSRWAGWDVFRMFHRVDCPLFP
jgi:hypothetical protein